MRPRWIWAAIALGLSCLLALGWAAWRAYDRKQCQSLLARARDEMNHNRWAMARAALLELLHRRTGWDEALYELGVCEEARGRVQAAADTWNQVPSSSAFMGWIEVRRSKIEMEKGRFDACETLLRSAADRVGPHRAEARWGLVLLLRMEGRFDEAKRWLEAGFDQMSDRIVTLVRLYRLDHDPYPTEGMRQALQRAGKAAPGDDRVWLGRAHLATVLGQFDEARDWLDRCLRRRPEDPVVWRMRLEWAVAANRPEEAVSTLAHLPADQEPAIAPVMLRAWFAARQGNAPAEQPALERALDLDPTNPPLLERMAELEIEAGRRDQAMSLRRRRSELELVRQEYQRRLFTTKPPADPAQMTSLALRLGRKFDALQWARIGNLPPPKRTDVEQAKASHRNSNTLADLLADIAGSTSLPAAEVKKTDHGTLRFSEDAGIARLGFVMESGSGAKGRMIPPLTFSGGVGLIDFDNDGWLDVYAVQGGPFPPNPKSTAAGDRLFRNRGDGTFEDATARSGIGGMPRGYGYGIAVGDYDNDGCADVFVTRWRSYALYHNRGDGTFEDATARAGLDGDRDWPTSAAFADLDGDGDLDLYVCHYLKWDEHSPRTCASATDPTIYNCSPIDFPALADHLFRNDGGRFVDVTAGSGMHDGNGRGLGVLAADLDADGKIDLFVANDMSSNYLFRNLGHLQFEETGLLAGIAGNASGEAQAGMGVAGGDLDGDGQIDVAVTNYYNESTSFFRNLGQGYFGEQSSAIGLAAPSRYVLGFGIAMPDVDNDGWLDLMTANGHIHDGRPQFPWKMPVQLYHNEGTSRRMLDEVSSRSGEPFQALHMGRGLAAGDVDNDGRIDALIVSQNEPLVYLHNRSHAGHFLTLRLEGKASNRDAVGARVTVRCGKRLAVAQRSGGGSYLSAGDPRLHFGLGSSISAEVVEVHWPSGGVDRYAGLKADTGYLLREGVASPQPLRGWRASR